MITAFDTNRDTRPFLPWLSAQGFKLALRYYTALQSPKRLLRAEAEALVRAGFTLGAVYQDSGTQAAHFGLDQGRAAGSRALRYAMEDIGQPPGSGIYFSIDFDVSKTELKNHVVPHFRGIREALTEAGQNAPSYRVGAYGSGLALKTLLDAGLIELAWLSMSMGFRESKSFFQSGRWNLHQKLEVKNADTPAGKFSYDPNQIGTSGAGDFTIELPPAPVVATRARVNARSGLLLRTGPGTEFPRLQSLPLNTQVFVLGHSGVWAKIDLQGDGVIDGFCHSDFLSV
jgi:hypothetical protein